MYWSEPDSQDQGVSACRMIDVIFRIKTRELPADHGFALCAAISEHLPWFASDPAAALHLIQAAPSANGWVRPDANAGEIMQLSKRTRLILRVTTERRAECDALAGKQLHVGDHRLEVGASKSRGLTPSPTLFCRHVLAPEHDNEEQFLTWFVAELGALGIKPRKLLAGMCSSLTTAGATIKTRSVLVAELSPGNSIELQCAGVGSGHTIGCGTFTPHKDIGPVSGADDYQMGD